MPCSHVLPYEKSKISPNAGNITAIAFAKLLCKIPLFRQYQDKMYRQKRYRSEERNPKIVQRNSKPKNDERHRDIHRIASEAIRPVRDQLRCGLPWTGCCPVRLNRTSDGTKRQTPAAMRTIPPVT